MNYTVFGDSNVFLVGLLQRGEIGLQALEIIELAESGRIKLFTSSSNLINLIYFLKKANNTNSQIAIAVKNMLAFITVISPNNSVFSDALDAGFSDLEDAIQYHTARQIKGIDYFITSNTKDFKQATSSLPVVTPKQFLSEYNKHKTR